MKKESLVGLAFFTVLVGFSIYIYSTNVGKYNNTTNSPAEQTVSSTPTPTLEGGLTLPESNPDIEDSEGVVKVKFDYTVKSIDEKNIVLNGKNGDMLIENNPAKVKVYFTGNGGKLISKTPKDLKVGDKVRLEFNEDSSLIVIYKI